MKIKPQKMGELSKLGELIQDVSTTKLNTNGVLLMADNSVNTNWRVASSDSNHG